MRSSIITSLIFTSLCAFTACTDTRKPTDPSTAEFHQEFMPKGQKTDMNPNDTLSLGQHDSIAHNP